MLLASRIALLLSAALLASAAVPVFALDHGSDNADFGLHASEHANIAELGLPFYPGSSRRHDKDGESPAANFGLWGGSFGIKLVVIKYRSSDAVNQVVDFYRNAMSRYGEVIDCSGDGVSINSHGDDPVSCDKDDAKPGQITLKVGKESSQRVVSVRRAQGETEFEMVYLRVKGD